MFGFLFSPQNPTKDWCPSAALQLAFDMSDARLNDVSLGESVDRLSFLGPVEGSGGLPSELCYFTLGLCGDYDPADRTITACRLVHQDARDDRFRPFSGDIQWNSTRIDLEELTEAQVFDRFGQPYWKDQDDKESILFYEFTGLEWQFEFDPQS